MRLARAAAVPAVVIVGATLLACRAYGQERLQTRKLQHGGREREVQIYTPAKVAAPVPLLIVLHGGGGNGLSAVRLTNGRFNALADRDGWLVAYPEAVENHSPPRALRARQPASPSADRRGGPGAWNDGRGDMTRLSHRENVDDVGFIGAIIDALPVDPRRVYVTGMSNGASMSHRLALETPGRFAAVAPVANAIPAPLTPTAIPAAGTPTTRTAVPILMIMGVEDPLVPYEGGSVHFYRRKLGEICSTREAVKIWVARNGADPAGKVSLLDDRDAADGTRVQREVHAGPAEVILLSVLGGGHTWPGGRAYAPEIVVGKTSRDIDACDVIWEFCKAHLREGAPAPPAREPALR